MADARKSPSVERPRPTDDVGGLTKALGDTGLTDKKPEHEKHRPPPLSPVVISLSGADDQGGDATTSPPVRQAPNMHRLLSLETGGGQSDLSDYELSDYEDDDDVGERRAMTVTEKARIEELITENNMHHEHSDDVPLLGEWCFWIDKNVKKGVSENSFLDSLHNLGTFGSSHGFSEVLLTYADELINIHQHSEKCNIRLFRAGITPIREDAANVLGGQYVVFLPKDRLEVQRLWLECLIAVVGEKFALKSQVTGVVLALKKRADTIAIWTDRGCHPSHYPGQKEHICEVLRLPRDSKIKYNNHTLTKKGSRPSSQQNSPCPSPKLQHDDRNRHRAISSPGQNRDDRGWQDARGPASPRGGPRSPASTTANWRAADPRDTRDTRDPRDIRDTRDWRAPEARAQAQAQASPLSPASRRVYDSGAGPRSPGPRSPGAGPGSPRFFERPQYDRPPVDRPPALAPASPGRPWGAGAAGNSARWEEQLALPSQNRNRAQSAHK